MVGVGTGVGPNGVVLVPPPKENGAGDDSFPNPGALFCPPNPEEPPKGPADVGADPKPFDAVLPNEKPGPLLASRKDGPAAVGGCPPPRIGLASMLSSSRVLVNGVVGPVGNKSPGLLGGGAAGVVLSPKLNPPVEGVLLAGG